MFVVYTHSKPTGEVFYVGKGSVKRSKATDNRNPYWRNIVKKHGFVVSVLAEYENEADALKHEIRLISELREAGLKIANITSGGEGVCGYVHTEASKQKMSAFQKKFQNSEQMVVVHKRNGELNKLPERRAAQSAKIKAYMSLPENRERSRQGALKLAENPEFIEAQRQRALERMKDPKYRNLLAKKCICVETGVVYDSYNSAVAWLKSIGHALASHSKISCCISGKRNSAYGYHWTTA